MLPGGSWRWGDTTSLDGVVRHFLRSDYGTFRLASQEADVAWWDHEDAGPTYPEGTARDSDGGETIWRRWYDANLTMCSRANSLKRAALALSREAAGSTGRIPGASTPAAPSTRLAYSRAMVSSGT